MRVELTVNGRVNHEVEQRSSLRLPASPLGLRGTHVGCEHGVCGACTVLVDGGAVRACWLLAVQARAARSRRSKGSPRRRADALQEAFRRHHGLQCGFCTPGILMGAAELLESGETRRARRSSSCSRGTCAAAPATPDRRRDR